jgi:hypothetical protein
MSFPKLTEAAQAAASLREAALMATVSMSEFGKACRMIDISKHWESTLPSEKVELPKKDGWCRTTEPPTRKVVV